MARNSPTKPRTGGRVPTESERLAAGWAPQRKFRFLQEEERAITERLLHPGESLGVGVRRILRGILGMGPVPRNRRRDEE